MTAYFVGVVRAPLTSVVIIMEMTGSHAMLLALITAAIIAEGVAAVLCPERLYHGLSKSFRQAPTARRDATTAD
jgi:H+/Cl- antiporter ClcA